MQDFELHHQFYLEYFFRCNHPEHPEITMPARVVRAKCSELVTRIEVLLDELSVPSDKEFMVHIPSYCEKLYSNDVLYCLNAVVNLEDIDAIDMDQAMLAINQALFMLFVGNEILIASQGG